MSPTIGHECTRVPVTALVSCGSLLIAAEGPFVRIFHGQNQSLLATKRIFKSQVIHGISVCSEGQDRVVFVVWGGPLLCGLGIDVSHRDTNGNAQTDNIINFHVSLVLRASDWIFDLSSRPSSFSDPEDQDSTWLCAAVTARNALVEVTVEKRESLTISLAELTAASRCILYSAHVLWSSSNHILVASGTAFGEIIVWSWMRQDGSKGFTHTHQTFLGHEGSIFGVCISEKLSTTDGKLRRLLASCSDDRSIRVWNIPDTSLLANSETALQEDYESSETKDTGFKPADDNADQSHSECVATGWGHMSRVWSVRFLQSTASSEADITDMRLLSTGEDATTRMWQIKPSPIPGADKPRFSLDLISIASHHTGKSIWAATVTYSSDGIHIISGGSDSRIIAYEHSLSNIQSPVWLNKEYTVQEICSAEDLTTHQPDGKALLKSSKNPEFFRSYAFLDTSTFLFTTNSGYVFLGHLPLTSPLEHGQAISSNLITRLEELKGYSVCVSISSLGIVFLAGARGTIYAYHRDSSELSKICQVKGKVANLHTSPVEGAGAATLFVTSVGQKSPQLLIVDAPSLKVLDTVKIPLSESLTGNPVTSMIHVTCPNSRNYVFLGFRKGTVAVYAIPNGAEEHLESALPQASLVTMIEKVHNKESVTSMLWVASPDHISSGHLFSVGRDGSCTAYRIDIDSPAAALVHRMALPVGTNLEGMYVQEGHLMIYGFQSTKFVLHNSTTEEEIMTVECGGAHRSWAFQPHSSRPGGTLVWTRASNMQVYTRDKPSHQVIRSGGHGREIKAVAISAHYNNNKTAGLVATGAEETLIKIFRYGSETSSTQTPDFTCIRTLRKHSTGIQHLQWSEDGEYLFSSGGCEEFYVWKVTMLPLVGLGVVCEAVCDPHSEQSDLRITSFDVSKRGSCFVICMVFSDSTLRIYTYDPSAVSKWQFIVDGTYATSCLTQSVLFPDMTITLGTDGHVTAWPLPFTIEEHSSGMLSTYDRPLGWNSRARIHQSSSKSLAVHKIDDFSTLLASGGDDGGLGIVVVSLEPQDSSPFSCPLVIPRAHASAVSSCTVWSSRGHVYLLTSGNDQWVKLWRVILAPYCIESGSEQNHLALNPNQYQLDIHRIGKAKTNVADVSSMAILETSDSVVKVVLCGVGMEVVRVEW